MFIIAKNLTKCYQIGTITTKALARLSITIKQGTVAAIVGPSGSGKTTLLNILGGLDQPTWGTITVAGTNLVKLDEASLTRYRREVVGFVWQQTGRNLLTHLTVQQNILLPMKLHGISYRVRNRRAAQLLTEVDISHRAMYRAKQLSGGEQQRAATAVALANRPGLLLADEPTGTLDTDTTADLMRLFRRLTNRYGLTVVIVTHDPIVAKYADQIIELQDGHLKT